MPHKIEFDDPLEDFTPPSALNGTVVEEEQHIWQILEVASANDDLQAVLDVVQRKNLRPRGYFAASAVVAIKKGNDRIVAALLDAGLTVDVSLVRAALRSSWKQQCLQLFVASGWDVNTRLTAQTPSVLALAAEAGHLELVIWLLQDMGADVNLECDHLHTPLSVAVRHAPDEVVDVMMSRTFEPDKGQLMHHALWRALEQPEWNTRLMDALLEKGTPINKKMYDCDEESEIVHQMRAIPFGTPLQIAVKAESAIAVEYLLRRGARSDVPNEQGNTPLQLATGEIRRILQSH